VVQNLTVVIQWHELTDNDQAIIQELAVRVAGRTDWVEEFIDNDYLREVREGTMTLEQAEAAIRNIRARRRDLEAEWAQVLRPPTERGSTEDWSRSFSIVIAEVAATDPEVQDFRSTHLGVELLQLDEVDAWVKQQQATDGSATRWVTCPEGEVGSPAGHAERSAKLLRYGTLDDWEHSVPTAHDRVLDKLRVISERLAGSLPWQAPQATTWVLTGITPVARVLDVHSAETSTPYGTFKSITLTIDPRLSPGRLATAYQQARQTLLHTGRVQPLRGRSPALVEFVHTHRGPSDWPRLHRLWKDEERQGWSHADAMNRAYRDAIDWLLHDSEGQSP